MRLDECAGLVSGGHGTASFRPVAESRRRSGHRRGLAIGAVLAVSLAAATIWLKRSAAEQNDTPRIAALAFDDLSSGAEKGSLGVVQLKIAAGSLLA